MQRAREIKFAFFAGYLTIYGGMHLYFYERLTHVFRLPEAVEATLFGLCVFQICIPPAVVLLDQAVWYRPVRVLSLISYPWMGLLLWFCVLAAGVDAWNLLLREFSAWFGWAPGLRLPPVAFLGVGVVSVLVALRGLHEAASVRVRTFVVRSPKFPPDARPLCMAQISDLHLGIVVRHRHLGRVLRQIRRAAPDLLVATGDLVDESFAHMESLARTLAEVEPPLGKFAVTGNHEYYAGASRSVEFLRQAGFHVLRGEAVQVAERFWLAGVDDLAGVRMGLEAQTREVPLRRVIEPDAFAVLLQHRPIAPAEDIEFDLQLSGHTHGGQLLPLTLLA